MPFDLKALLSSRQQENVSLHAAHINPQFAKVLRTIGFDRHYTRAQGAYLYDDKGHRYLDFLAGYAVYNIGRNHPVVRDALRQFLQTDLPSLVQMEAPLLSGILAEELKKRVPSALDTVYFTNSGTECVETAIKFARCATQKPRILYCEHAFHGLTNGSLSLNGEHWFREGFNPLLPATKAIPFNNSVSLAEELAKGDVAAVFIEPIQGKGVYIAQADYLRKAQALCRKHGALLVLDEIQTGLGRTGKLFAMEYSGVVPDILLLSKALSGGYIPVGAVLTSRTIYNKVFNNMQRCVVHSSTFGQGAMAMIAGLASLHVIDDENLVDNAQRQGQLLLNGLQDLAEQYEVISAVRGRGLMIGIEFARPRSLKLKMGWDLANKLNKSLFTQAIVISLFKDHGILTQVAGRDIDIIKLIPPLIINEADVTYFLNALANVLERSQRFPGPVLNIATSLAKATLKRNV